MLCDARARVDHTHAPFAWLCLADVGQSVVHYAKENGVDLVVLGARGMGSWKRWV